jgi:glyoxylase-like metal-dependent hydrolase (beta-lactamase superfamily II)
VNLRRTRIGERVLVWTLGGDSIPTSYGANCTAVIGRDSVLVVDPFIAPALARFVEAEVANATPLPVSHVVLTHHHTDHALGAGWFASREVRVVAHPACAEAMAAEHPGLIEARRRVPELSELFRDAEPYRPAVLVDDGLRIDLGGPTATVVHPGPGHTSGDLIVFVEDESVVLCGDLVSVGYHVNYEDAALSDLAGGLVLDYGARTYVPGHGPPGGSEIVRAQRVYHAAARAASSPQDLRTRYPDHLLSELLPQTVAAWRRLG